MFVFTIVLLPAAGASNTPLPVNPSVSPETIFVKLRSDPEAVLVAS